MWRVWLDMRACVCVDRCVWDGSDTAAPAGYLSVDSWRTQDVQQGARAFLL